MIKYTDQDIRKAAAAMDNGDYPADPALAAAALAYKQISNEMAEFKGRVGKITYREVKKEDHAHTNPVAAYMAGASSALAIVVLGLGVWMMINKGKAGAASIGALGDAVAG